MRSATSSCCCGPATGFRSPAALAEATEGFSGSEIEEVVGSALYSAFSGSRTLDTEAVRLEVDRTRPLSVTMAERIDALRAWAAERAVSAI
jgi:hypothetical protein